MVSLLGERGFMVVESNSRLHLYRLFFFLVSLKGLVFFKSSSVINKLMFIILDSGMVNPFLGTLL